MADPTVEVPKCSFCETSRGPVVVKNTKNGTWCCTQCVAALIKAHVTIGAGQLLDDAVRSMMVNKPCQCPKCREAVNTSADATIH